MTKTALFKLGGSSGAFFTTRSVSTMCRKLIRKERLYILTFVTGGTILQSEGNMVLRGGGQKPGTLDFFEL